MSARTVVEHCRLRGVYASGSLLLLISRWLMWNGCVSQAGPPKLVVPEAALQLGEGLPGDELAGSFLVTNAGGEALRIEKLEAGCGCAAVNLEEDVVPPGAAVQVQVTVRLKDAGQLLFPVRIHSNDPLSPVTVYHVRAALTRPALATDPARVNFGEIPRGLVRSRRLNVLKADGTPWPRGDPLNVAPARGFIEAELVRPSANAPKGVVVIEVRPRADLPLGSFEDALAIRASAGGPGLSVPVQGHVRPRIVATPGNLCFGDLMSGSDPMKRFLLIRRTDGKGVSPVLRSTGPGGITVEEMRTAGAAAATTARRLVVTLQPNVVTEDIKDGKMSLWLEDEPEPVIVGVMIFLSRKIVEANP